MGLALGMVLALGLISLIVYQGLMAFWPRDIGVFTLKEPYQFQGQSTFAAQFRQRKAKAHHVPLEYQGQYFVGNRDYYGLSFIYQDEAAIESVDYPPDILLLTQRVGGDLIAWPLKLELQGKLTSSSHPLFHATLEAAIAERRQAWKKIHHLEKKVIGEINRLMEKKRLSLIALNKDREKNAEGIRAMDASIQELEKRYQAHAAESTQLRAWQKQGSLEIALESGGTFSLPLADIERFHAVNALSFWGKLGVLGKSLWQFVSEPPREANTKGGVFPALFGTLIMTLVMALLVTPFGVLAAIYLHEYAKDSYAVRCVRIGISNLAAVPSIVYGVFGLGFFVYLVGSSIDEIFYSERLPIPTFGTGGLLWASLTLALLTLPVVVIAAEEALSSIPPSLRQASLACGASKWQTVWNIVLPAASPGILTGMILAMARGAGEVAPLMLVGVVKMAPDLPFDGTAPFLHLDRKFMHLAFHIYDLGFQSPDSEAAKPMVFATALLLIVLVFTLNMVAIFLRERLRSVHVKGTF